jgi:hypothetical protein
MSEQLSFDTLAIAKKELWEEMKRGGIDCPCCGRYARLYVRTIGKAQIAAFQWIMLNTTEKKPFINVQAKAPKWLLRSNSHGKLVHWGLLQQQLSDDDSIHHSGVWGVSEFGQRFFYGEASIRQYALVFNNQCFGFEGAEKWFCDVYDRFYYAELMQQHADDLVAETIAVMP